MPPTSHKIVQVSDLTELQEWMCGAIRTPMSKQASITPDPVYYLTPNAQLTARERLEIYADDYWSRCFNMLHDNFPGLAEIWGHETFHRWSEQYLVQCSSSSFTLRDLGNKFESFISSEYHGQDSALVLDMLRYEWARIEAFDRPVLPPFDPEKLSAQERVDLASLTFALQPHISLLQLDYPVFEVVDKLISRKTKKTIPVPTKGEYFTVVYRHDFIVYHKEIDKAFYLLLTQIQGGKSLADGCDAILPLLDKEQINRLEKKARTWFQQCVALQWLGAPVKSGESGDM